MISCPVAGDGMASLRPKRRNTLPGRMKDLHFALAVSVILHLSIVLIFAVLVSEPRKGAEIVVADLTLVTGPGSVKEGPGQKEGGRPGGKRNAPSPSRSPAPSGQAASPDPGRRQSVVPVMDQVPSPQADSAASIPPYGSAGGEGREDGHGSGRSEGTGTGGSPRSGGSGKGNGGPGNGQGEAIQGGSDYYYIRDTVMKNIRYPERARRMGLEGKVVLSFVVLENGATREVRVVSGSGFSVLDENAKEGVENTVMRKKMPHRVVVTLPITYKIQ